jgi:cytochrome d ubiquinol oxidase subunit II
MLALIWLGIIAFCIIMYVILDGFTLGTGMLLPFLNDKERDIASSVILPTWDGNQTWLVLGMASLYGAFPLAFSILLPLFYLPLLLLVVSLLFRGAAFEFRLKAPEVKHRWEIIFVIASITATLIQGYIIGNFVEGFSLVNGEYSVASHFSLFTFLTSVSLVTGYALLGTCRLILKTSGALQDKMYRIAKILSFFLMAAVIAVSLWTPFVYPLVKSRWFNTHYLPYLAILPSITAIAFLGLWWSLSRKKEILPYWLAVILFLCPYVGLMISIFPYIVPYHLTLWQAASDVSSLKFLLVGAVIMLPVLLAYTGYAYYIFRGKVNENIHY